jgi:hypothetical protein
VKRFSIWIATGIMTLLILLAIIYIFRDRIIAPYVEKVVIRELESRLGVGVEIEKVDGTFFTTLELTGIRTVEVQPESAVTELALQRGRATYWLPDIVFGSDHLLKNARITLDGARLEIDLDRPPPDEEIEDEQPTTLPSPESFPDLRVSDSWLSLRGSGLHLELAGLDASLQKADRTVGTGPLTLDLQAAAAAIDHPRINRQAGSLAALLHYDRERLVLEDLQFADQSLVRHAILDFRQQGVLALDASLQLLDGGIEVQGELAETLLAARIRTDPLTLRSFSDFLAPDLPEFTGELTVVTDFQIDTANPSGTLRGNLDFRLLNGSVRRIPIDSIQLQAAAIPEEIVIQKFEGQISANTLVVDGIGIPAATIFEQQWSELLDASPGTFSLQFKDIPALIEITGREITIREQTIPLHHLTLQGNIGNRVLAITQGLLETKTGLVEVKQARLELPPEAEWKEVTILSNLTIDVPHLAEVGSIFGMPGLQGALAGKIDVGGTLGAPSGQASVKGQNLVFRDLSLGNWQLLAAADRQSVHVQTLTMARAGDRLSGSGSFHLQQRTLEDVALKFNLGEISYYRELLPLEQELAGSLAGNLTAAGPLDQPTVQLTATARAGRIAGLAVDNAEVQVRSRQRTIEIAKANLKTEHGSLALTGQVIRGPQDRTFEARLATLILTTPDGGEMQLVKPATLTYSVEDIFTARDVLLRGNIGEIRMDGRLSRQADSELTVRLTGLTSRYWLSLLMDERLSFEGMDALIIFKGSWQNPYIQTNGQLESMSIQELPFPVSGSFDLDLTPGGLAIREFAWQGQDSLALYLTGTLPVNFWKEEIFLPGSLSLSGLIEIPTLEPIRTLLPPDMTLEGALGGDIRLTGTWHDPVGHLQLHGWGVRARHPDLPAPFQPADLTADLLVQGDELQLNALRLTSPDLEFAADGRWTKGPALRNLLRGRDLHLIGALDMKGKIDIPDIAWLGRGIEPIRRLRGSLQAELALTGPAQDPKVEGTMQLSQGELRTNWNIPPIEAFDIEAELGDHRIVLREARGQLGGAPFTMTGNIVRDRELGPVFALELQGSNILLFRDEWTIFRADSDIALNGPWRQMAVSGELALTEGFYRKNVAYLDLLRGSDRPKPVGGMQLFSFRDEPLRSMTFDVAIRPKNPFRIDNNLARGTLRPDLTITGTGELPVMVGAIYVDEIRIRLPTTRLEVEAGLVQFTTANPNRPIIDLLAHTRMVGYDIDVQLEGTVDEPVVILSSTPPLPEDDLLLLLLAGRLPQNGIGAGEFARAGGLNIAMYVGRGLLADWLLGDDVPEESLLERFQLEIGRGITRMGRETLEAQIAIAEDLLKREDALFVTAERDVYDDFNVGIKFIFRFR